MRLLEHEKIEIRKFKNQGYSGTSIARLVNRPARTVLGFLERDSCDNQNNFNLINKNEFEKFLISKIKILIMELEKLTKEIKQFKE